MSLYEYVSLYSKSLDFSLQNIEWFEFGDKSAKNVFFFLSFFFFATVTFHVTVHTIIEQQQGSLFSFFSTPNKALLCIKTLKPHTKLPIKPAYIPKYSCCPEFFSTMFASRNNALNLFPIVSKP